MPGTITFKPIEANLTHDTDLLSKADPYCMFTVGKQKVKGQVCKSGGKHPVWNDSVTIPASTQPICLVEVKDKDFLKDDKMGSFEIDLREIESQGRLQKWFPLVHKNKPVGELLMEAIYTPDVHSQGMPMKMGMGMGLGMPTTGTHVITGGVPVSNNTTTTTQKTQVITKETHLINGGMAPLGTHTHTHTHTQPHLIQGHSHGTHIISNTTIPTTTFTTVAPTTAYQATNLSTADQYAREAIIRGVDPLGTHLHQPTAGFVGANNFVAQPHGIDAHNYGTNGTHHHNQHYPSQQMTFGHGRNMNQNKF